MHFQDYYIKGPYNQYKSVAIFKMACKIIRGMDVKGFPFRIDERTHVLLSGLIGALNSSNARMQSLMQDQCVITFDKSVGNGVDTMARFTKDGLILRYALSTIVKNNQDISGWLNGMHGKLQKQKKDQLKPVLNRCFVDVIASYNGTVNYYLTYMVAHSDESIAQDTPQGSLYATESLNVPRRKEPARKESAGFW